METIQDNGAVTSLMERPLTPVQNVPIQRREIRVVEDKSSLANLMDTARFEHLQRIAALMAASSLLPDHLVCSKKEGPFPHETIRANCFRVVNQALRWGIDPFAMVDETYVVGGKLGYQGKLVAAVVNTRASLQRRLAYSFEGTGDNRVVTVSGTFEGESEPRTSTLRLGDAKTENQMWRKDPDQKLIYSGVVKWARRYCPEVVLGVLTDDDIDRMNAQALTPPTPISSQTLAQQFNESAAPAATGPRINPFPDDAEANRIIEEKVTQSRQQQRDAEATKAEPEASQLNPAAEQESQTGDADQTAEAPDFPATLPDSARENETFIAKVIEARKPAVMEFAVARRKFRAALGANSWHKLPRAEQDAVYEKLMSGWFSWK